MAGSRIQGITIEIGGDTTKLSESLSGINKDLRTTQSQLRDVNKLLKLDPTNTDLLKQKQKYLSEEIKGTKEKLEQEKTAMEQLKDAPQTEETTKQQEALTREIEDTTQKLKDLEDQYKSVGSVSGTQLEAAGQKMQETGKKISRVGETVTKGVTVPVAAAAAASVASWKEVDDAMDTVEKKTGASGKALEDMQGSVKTLATTINTDFGSAGTAVGEVNTRFGLTGDALTDLSGQFIKFADLNNTDVNTSIDNVSAALNAFGQDSGDAGSLLDALNKVGQDTGLSVDTLASSLQTNAVQLKAMGFNAQQSANFLGKVEASGLDTKTMLTGLQKAQKNCTKDGKTLNQGMKDFSDVMKSNASETDKLQAAYDLFGNKAGAAIYNACSTGKLSLDDLSGSFTGFEGSVTSTFDATQGPLDQFQTTMNQLKLIGADIVDTAAPAITSVAQTLGEVVKDLADKWNGLSEGQQQFIIKAALVAAAVGPVITGIGGVITTVGTLTKGIGDVMNAISAAGALSNPTILIIAGIAAAIVGIIAIVKNWGAITEWFKGVWEKVCSGVQAVGEALGSFFSGLWDGIKTATSTAWDAIKTAVTTVWNGLKTTASTVFNGIKTAITTVWDGLKTATSTVWSGIKTAVTTVWNGLKKAASTMFTGIKTVITGVWGGLKTASSTAWNGIKTAVTTVWNGMKSGATTIFNGIKTSITNAWNAVKTGTSTAWNNIKTSASNIWNGMKSGATTTFNGIKTSVTNAWNTLKSNTSTVWSGIKSVVQQHGGGIKGVISTAIDGYKSIWKAGFDVINRTTGGKLGEALSTARSKLDSIKQAFSDKMGGARDAVKNAIDRIKGFFHFSWSLPRPKIPHFTWTWRKVGPVSIPNISVEWYAKAMRNGMILDSPTIFGAAGGKLLGGGEAGAEAVVGVNSLKSMIQQAVASGLGVTNNSTNYGGVNIVVYGAPGQSVSELADIIEERINANVLSKEAVFA